MLSTLIIWFYSLVIIFLYGWLAVKLLAGWSGLKSYRPVPFYLYWLVGLCAITTIASVLSLFMPLDGLADAILLVGALLVGGTQSHEIRLRLSDWIAGLRKVPWVCWILAGLAALTVIEAATHLPNNPDTGIYHAQAIHWIESFPAVPGLGNLHTRFAFNSSWLVANAAFSFAFLGLRSFHLLPGVLFIVASGYLGGGIANIYRRQTRPADVLKLLLFPLAFIAMAGEISSPGTDLPAALLTWIILAAWVELMDAGRSETALEGLLLVLLCLFAVTIKLSAAPLLLGAGVMVGQLLCFRSEKINKDIKDGQDRQDNNKGKAFNFKVLFTLKPAHFLLRLAIIGLVVVVPWMVRSAIVSGYLIYPQPVTGFFHFDWQIPVATAQQEQLAIAAWARLPGKDPATVMAMPFKTWAPLWFSRLTANRRVILIFILAALPLYGALALVWGRSSARFWESLRRLAPVGLVAYAGIAFWFISAPDFRFGYGFIFITLALVLTPLVYAVLEWSGRRLALVSLILAALIIFQGGILLQSFDSRTISNRLLLPVDYLNLPTHPCHFGNFDLVCADQYSACGYYAFPCVPQGDKSVFERGKTYRDGFFHPDK